jgi:polysaccharide deacetylase family protein (PEP-CTERM system associated)
MKTNAMTVDVEDYFQVSAFEPYIAKEQWDTLPHRVERNTYKILDLFKERNIKATFFTLGWVAERYPDLIKRMITEQFRNDVSKSKKLLEDLSGEQVNGYRAASYSIGANNLWALNVLQEEGFKYSSSIYPVKHDIYGMPDAPRFIYEPIENQNFKEIPISTVRFGDKNFPCGGGGFFRFYSYALSKWAFNRINNKENESAIFYFHPWEIDPEQPRQSGLNLRTRTRHYLNLNQMENRIERLLTDFNWDTMANVFQINE